MNRPLPNLEPAATALILIDLQRGVVSRQTAPRPAAEVVQSCSRLAEEARRLGVLVVKCMWRSRRIGPTLYAWTSTRAIPPRRRPGGTSWWRRCGPPTARWWSPSGGGALSD